MARANGVRDIDRGMKALMKRLFSEPVVLSVGIQDEKAAEQHADTMLTNQEIGTFHEFGTKTIPERSFIRATVDNKNGYIDLIRKIAVRVVDGSANTQQALGILGEKVVSDIKTRIESKIPPPLKDATIARKGSSTPLIDTSQLKNSITWKIKPEEKKA